MLFLTCPPLTRLSQLRGALGFGLGAAVWEHWQYQTNQPLPANFLSLPLPENDLMVHYLQAWGNLQDILHLTPRDLALEQLLIWGLGSSDQAWAKASFTSPSQPTAQPTLSSLRDTFLESLYQALHGELLVTPILEHWLRAGMNQNNNTGAWAESSGELRGLLWGSLYGAKYGWSCLPPLWLIQLPPELEILANYLFRAWSGQIGHEATPPLAPITTAGYLYPR